MLHLYYPHSIAILHLYYSYTTLLLWLYYSHTTAILRSNNRYSTLLLHSYYSVLPIKIAQLCTLITHILFICTVNQQWMIHCWLTGLYGTEPLVKGLGLSLSQADPWQRAGSVWRDQAAEIGPVPDPERGAAAVWPGAAGEVHSPQPLPFLHCRKNHTTRLDVSMYCHILHPERTCILAAFPVWDYDQTGLFHWWEVWD